MNNTRNQSVSTKNLIKSKLPKNCAESVYIMLGVIILFITISIFYYCEPMIEVFDINNASAVSTYKWSRVNIPSFKPYNIVFILLSISSMTATIALTLLTFFEKPLEKCFNFLYGIIISSVVSILSTVIPLFILKGLSASVETKVIRPTLGGVIYIILNIIIICIALFIKDKIKENLKN